MLCSSYLHSTENFLQYWGDGDAAEKSRVNQVFHTLAWQENHRRWGAERSLGLRELPPILLCAKLSQEGSSNLLSILWKSLKEASELYHSDLEKNRKRTMHFKMKETDEQKSLSLS